MTDYRKRADSWPAGTDTVLFVDESGDRDLENISPKWPILSLFGAVITWSEYKKLHANLIALKKRLWPPAGYWLPPGAEKPQLVVFHCYDMRHKKGPFAPDVLSEEKRAEIDTNLWNIIERTAWQGIACIIDKRRLIRAYPEEDNPYNLAVKFMLERFYLSYRDRSLGVVFEARGKGEDHNLRVFIETELVAKGTEYISGEKLQKQIEAVGWSCKRGNGGRLLSGLEIADLGAYIAGASYIGRKPKWRGIIRRHLLGYPTSIRGCGTKVFPQKEKGA